MYFFLISPAIGCAHIISGTAVFSVTLIFPELCRGRVSLALPHSRALLWGGRGGTKNTTLCSFFFFLHAVFYGVFPCLVLTVLEPSILRLIQGGGTMKESHLHPRSRPHPSLTTPGLPRSTVRLLPALLTFVTAGRNTLLASSLECPVLGIKKPA